jgi:hypothetical protein
MKTGFLWLAAAAALTTLCACGAKKVELTETDVEALVRAHFAGAKYNASDTSQALCSSIFDLSQVEVFNLEPAEKVTTVDMAITAVAKGDFPNLSASAKGKDKIQECLWGVGQDESFFNWDTGQQLRFERRMQFEMGKDGAWKFWRPTTFVHAGALAGKT